MEDVSTFLVIAVGVLVGVVQPALAGYMRKEFPPATAGSGIPSWVKRYLGLFVFCLLTGLLVFAIWKSANPEARLAWFTAFLLGYGYESFIEKSLPRRL